MTDPHEISIGVAKGIGPARRGLFARLGIRSVADALYHFPRSYSDRRHAVPIAELESGTTAVVIASVHSFSFRKLSWKKSILTVKVWDDTGVLDALWFNQPYLQGRFSKGQRLALFGKGDRDSGGRYQMVHPEIRFLDEEGGTSADFFGIIPIYPATEHLRQSIVRRTLQSVVEQFAGHLEEFIPLSTQRSHRLLPLHEALRNVHFPENWELLRQARKRLIFQEFFLLQMGVALRKRFIKTAEKTRHLPRRKGASGADRFLGRLPFSLTTAQRKAVEELRGDLSSPKPMNRLLHGDVGCGKTIVALWAMLRAVEGGYQACLMSPTELLARQHFARVSALLAKENCRVGLLVSSVGCKDKCLEEISQGRTDIVIGTQAVLQKKVEFRRLGLAVVDEQHRFGVIQRFRLFEKGDFPDVLVLSATPIPRTLCQTVYGDMDVSVIDEMPPGRLPVVTKCFAASNIQEAFGELRRFIRGGNRAYVVCPTIEGDESSRRTSAVETHKQLATRVFSDMKVGLLHGGMGTEERERTITEFRKGGLDILVTTTVIEIGIDVPDAGAILITNGECFGLAQLHQMRGRVGRGGRQGYCLVVAEPQTDAAKERLHIFERTNDGFQIAREDLRLRGVGEFFGTRQHGLPELGIGDLFEHGELMRLARKEAVRVVNGQTPLCIEERESLASEVARTYGEKFRLGFV